MSFQSIIGTEIIDETLHAPSCAEYLTLSGSVTLPAPSRGLVWPVATVQDAAARGETGSGHGACSVGGL